jgi:hypothetical protein
MNVQEIGSCNAILKGVKTTVDGSLNITLEINPEEQEIASKLLKAYLLNEKLFSVGFIKILDE